MASDFYNFDGYVVIGEEKLLVHVECMDGRDPAKNLSNVQIVFPNGDTIGTETGYCSYNPGFKSTPIYEQVRELVVAGEANLVYMGGWSPDGSAWGSDDDAGDPD
jgi:hypothetical protein